MARMIELSRQGVDGKFYYWGTYNADVKSELMALVQAVWEFGVHKENYRAIESGTKEEKMDVLIKSLSEAQYEKAIRAEIGYIPKYHKGKYGAKYDYHSCGQCGASIEVINNYCPNCGYRVLWTNPRCLTSYHTKEEDDELQG